MSATSTSVMSVIRKVPVFLEAIKIEHAAFTLPFAYLAMLLAADGLPTLWQFIWVSVAMTAGRTAAMSLNRIIDRHLDSRNPRTAVRALPQGILTPQFMWGASIVTLAIMVLAAAMLNPLCVLLSPVAIFWLVFYSYTKRFTWLSHFRARRFRLHGPHGRLDCGNGRIRLEHGAPRSSRSNLDGGF